MDVSNILKYAIAAVSVILIVLIVLQTRSGGLGTVFGGGAGTDLYKSRRGFEAVLYNGTIVCGILLAVLSIALAIVNV